MELFTNIPNQSILKINFLHSSAISLLIVD